MAARKRAAVYLRVSTEEQTLDNQRGDIKRVLRSRRLRQVASFEEQVSAAKARPEFDAMMEAAHRGSSTSSSSGRSIGSGARWSATSRPSSTSTAAGSRSSA